MAIKKWDRVMDAFARVIMSTPNKVWSFQELIKYTNNELNQTIQITGPRMRYVLRIQKRFRTFKNEYNGPPEYIFVPKKEIKEAAKCYLQFRE